MRTGRVVLSEQGSMPFAWVETNHGRTAVLVHEAAFPSRLVPRLHRVLLKVARLETDPDFFEGLPGSDVLKKTLMLRSPYPPVKESAWTVVVGRTTLAEIRQEPFGRSIEALLCAGRLMEPKHAAWFAYLKPGVSMDDVVHMMDVRHVLEQ